MSPVVPTTTRTQPPPAKRPSRRWKSTRGCEIAPKSEARGSKQTQSTKSKGQKRGTPSTSIWGPAKSVSRASCPRIAGRMPATRYANRAQHFRMDVVVGCVPRTISSPRRVSVPARLNRMGVPPMSSEPRAGCPCHEIVRRRTTYEEAGLGSTLSSSHTVHNVSSPPSECGSQECVCRIRDTSGEEMGSVRPRSFPLVSAKR
jgi:hypothetical protein